jgi:integrase
MIKRQLADGRTITARRNDGLRKRCECARRAWASCDHPWHFSFKWNGTHHRFSLDKHAEQPIGTKDDAHQEADRLRRLIRAGSFPPAPAPVVATPEALTFEQFADRWVTNARSTQSKNQQMNDKGIVRRLSKLDLGGVRLLGAQPIGVLTVDDWETAFRQLTGAASTLNKYRQAILMMQEWAIDKGYLPRPWVVGKVLESKKGGIIGRRKGARRDRRLVPDVLNDTGKIKHQGEERRLLAKADAWLQRLMIAALETGCRRGELLSLQWRDVSLSHGQLTCRAEKTKTATMRQIPISTRLKPILQMVEHGPDGKPHAPAAYVFGNAVGERMAFQKKAWASCCKAAGIDRLQFRDLRHEAASRMLEAGWPLHHVQVMLGHQDTKTTSIYLNATIQELADSMKRFGTGGQSLHDVAQPTETEPPPVVQDEHSAQPKSLVN